MLEAYKVLSKGYIKSSVDSVAFDKKTTDAVNALIAKSKEDADFQTEFDAFSKIAVDFSTHGRFDKRD